MTSEPEELKIIVDEIKQNSGNDNFQYSQQDSEEESDGFGDRIAKSLLTKFAPIIGGATIAIGALESTIRISNAFAAKIEENSMKVQIGQVQADLIKLRADREADRYVGNELKQLIVLQAKQDAAWTKVQSEIVKTISPWAQTFQEFKVMLTELLATFAGSFVNISKEIHDYLRETADFIVEFIRTMDLDKAARYRDEKAEERARAGVDASKKRAFGMFEFVTDLNGAAGMMGAFPTRVPQSAPISIF
jgi:CRISPR/Cas system CMR-associated protein Cmr5 small subunit